LKRILSVGVGLKDKLIRFVLFCCVQIPTTLGLELATNPFLRPSSEEIRKSVRAKPEAPDSEVFAAVRRKKDSF
jgi:hypothetical protein